MNETKWPYNFDVTLFLTSWDNHFLGAREQRIIMGREIWLSFCHHFGSYKIIRTSLRQSIPKPPFPHTSTVRPLNSSQQSTVSPGA